MLLQLLINKMIPVIRYIKNLESNKIFKTEVINHFKLLTVIFILLLTFFSQPVLADNINNAVRTVVDELTSELFMEISVDQDYKIAVADFLNQNNQKTRLSNFISENVIVSLTNESSSNIKILERQRLNSVLEEQDRITSGVLKKETSEKIGELLGADSIIIGKYYNIKKDIHLIAKLVSIETGYIHSAVRIKIKKDNIISAMLGESYLKRTMN